MTGLIDEAKDGQNTPLNADLDSGLDQLSYSQTITFTKYLRVILPLDGFAFWVKATLINQDALLASGAMGASMPAIPPGEQSADEVVVKGSFHYITDMTQEEVQMSSFNRVVFTAQDPIQAFNSMEPDVMYIGFFSTPVRLEDGTVASEGETIRFAFSQRDSFYRQAELYHYVGHAVYNALDTQIIDDPRDLDTRLVVSNSLPVWLSMNSYVENQEWELFQKPSFPLYPSFLAPQNELPPYATVHVEPSSTRGIASTPTIGPTASHDQLCSEIVRITFFGVRNEQIMDFVDFVNQFSVNTDFIGIMNIPVVRDEKHPQVEFNAIAMRKAIDYEVSYYQHQARELARQLIKTVIVHYQVGSEQFN